MRAKFIAILLILLFGLSVATSVHAELTSKEFIKQLIETFIANDAEKMGSP